MFQYKNYFFYFIKFFFNYYYNFPIIISENERYFSIIIIYVLNLN